MLMLSYGNQYHPLQVGAEVQIATIISREANTSDGCPDISSLLTATSQASYLTLSTYLFFDCWLPKLKY